jgi:hypothetical protein
VGATVLEEVRRLIEQSGSLREDDARWPEPSRGGRQELEVVLGDKHLFLLVGARISLPLCFCCGPHRDELALAAQGLGDRQRWEQALVSLRCSRSRTHGRGGARRLPRL